jgi:hypothetical protein
MVFIGMEGKLLLYEHGHQAKLQTLKNLVQTPPDGPFDYEDSLWEVLIQYIGCNKALALLRLHSSPQLECLIS